MIFFEYLFEKRKGEEAASQNGKRDRPFLMFTRRLRVRRMG